jgi:hypothetical protein
MCDESWRMCLEEKKRNRSVYIGIDDDSTVREFEWATVQRLLKKRKGLDSERIELGQAIVA